MLESYLSLFAKATFVENMALAFFLGMCSFLAVSKKVETAIGLGGAVIFVLAVTCPANQVIHEYLLREGALAWISPELAEVDLSFLNFLVFIGKMAYKRFSWHTGYIGHRIGEITVQPIFITPAIILFFGTA